MIEFDDRVKEIIGGDLRCDDISTVQVNEGLLCNQKCTHCHLTASPRRREIMGWETKEDILRVAGHIQCDLGDITVGAPGHIKNFDQKMLSKRGIVTSKHCFGCTAGSGSSCGGALI